MYPFTIPDVNSPPTTGAALADVLRSSASRRSAARIWPAWVNSARNECSTLPLTTPLVDDGNLQRVSACGLAHDEAGVLLDAFRRDGSFHLTVDLTIDQPSSFIDKAIGEREPAVAIAPAIDLCRHQDAELVARGVAQCVGRELQSDVSRQRRRFASFL